jgi:hypothetical protein
VTRFQRVRSLHFEEWSALATAFVAVAVVRVSLWVLSFGRVLEAIEEHGEGRSRKHSNVERTAWAVEAAARRIPQATCLTQALAAKFLLARGGVASTVRFGFARSFDRRVEGHAWLECEGRIILGHRGLDRYTEFGAAESNDG